jgi:DNA-binding NarL/FixJ family response regulator
MKIFVAHSDSTVLGSIQSNLALKNNCSVEGANSHQNASVSLACNRYDLVIMQYSMIRGRNLVAMIELAQAVSPNVEVWIVGGSFSHEEVEVATAAGAQKIINITELFQELRQLKVAV